MTYNEVMKQLESLGTEQTRKIYRRHGCDIEQFGVSVANLKKVLKSIKKDTELGRQLFLSSNADAIYLSHWIVDSKSVSLEEIEQQILSSNYYMLIEYAIPAIISKDIELSHTCLSRWLDHSEPRFRQAAYSLYSLLVTMYDDEDCNLNLIKEKLEHIKHNIHTEENRVRYTMNQFVIATGASIVNLTTLSKEVAKTIGNVHVNMGETSCKVPYALSYIEKIESMNKLGQKRR